MKPELQQALDEARARLRALYGDRLQHVILYGSQARGDAGPESDVDVLVVLNGPFNMYQEIKRLVRLDRDLFERYRLDFSFQPYNEETYQDLRRPFIQNVHSDGVEL
ncbi:MAG TPA: nucleotidyltransferase domain-containing protein [Rhodothermales bacterium]|nr:nucleotidyltransferase domain-containing protein [Rhodothermales bacterium]